jgi:ankyrin repeat protein
LLGLTGIEINKAGDLGYTPLHVACMKGNVDMAKFLVERGADLFALSEGEPPFTVARRGGHDHVCELLAPLMEKAQMNDPKIWVRARIRQIRREIANLEKKL